MVLDMAVPGSGTAATAAAAAASSGTAGAAGATAACAATDTILSNVGNAVTTASSIAPGILTRAAAKVMTGI
jgi:hypothetical protein